MKICLWIWFIKSIDNKWSLTEKKNWIKKQLLWVEDGNEEQWNELRLWSCSNLVFLNEWQKCLRKNRKKGEIQLETESMIIIKRETDERIHFAEDSIRLQFYWLAAFHVIAWDLICFCFCICHNLLTQFMCKH